MYFLVWSPGDEILDVNGIPIKGLTFQEAIHTFKVTVSPWISFDLILFSPSGFCLFAAIAIWPFPPTTCLAANPKWVVCPHCAHEVTQPQPHTVLHSHAHEQIELPKLQYQWGTPNRRRPWWRWFCISWAEGSWAQRQDCHGSHTQQRYP